MANTLPDANVTIKNGGLGVQFANGDDLLAVISCAGAGDVNTPLLIRTQDALADEFESGPGVEFGSYYVNVTRKPLLFCRATTATAGARAAIDVTGVMGASIVTSSGTPVDTFDLRWLVVAGGVVGTAGITFKVSKDGGKTYGPVFALGTARSYEVPGTGVTLLFSVDEVGLIIAVNEAVADYEAHRILTAGSVHGAADSTNAVTAPVATTVAMAITRLNEAVTDFEAHRIRIASSVHGAADITNVITAPLATNALTAVARVIDFKAKFNAHGALTAGSVHGAADITNVITSANPDLGSLAAGDVVRQQTTEPLWDAAGLTAAFAALRDQRRLFRAALVIGDATATVLGTVKTAVNNFESAFRYSFAFTSARDRTSGETEAQWVTALDTEYTVVESDRIAASAGYARITSPIGGWKYRRPFIWAAATWYMNFDVHVSIAEVDLGALPGVAIEDEFGNLEEHDSRVTAGLLDARFITARTFLGRPGVFVALPLMLSAPGSDFARVHLRGVMDVFCTVVHRETEAMLSKGVKLNRSTGFIQEAQAKRLEGRVLSALKVALLQPGRASAVSYAFSRTDPLATPGTKLHGAGECLPLGYLEGIESELAYINTAIARLQGGP